MLGLGLSGWVPPALRPQLRRSAPWIRFAPTIAQCFALSRGGHRQRRTAFRGHKVAILGLFGSRVGIGRAANLLAHELEIDGSVVCRIDVTEQLGMEIDSPVPGVLGIDALDDLTVTDIVVHANPPEFYHLLKLVGMRRLAGRCLVGYFAWEVERIPGWWRGAIAGVSEIWVPSTFVRDTIKATVPRAAPRVRVRPHRIDIGAWLPASPSERSQARRVLGLDETAFVALTSFAMTSTLMRKNPLGAISSFRHAFEDPRGNEVLLVRCLDGERYPAGLAQIRQSMRGDPRLRFLSSARGPSLLTCYQAADAYLTLHRGEGYGLNIDEALAMKIPVVATSYSLNGSFLAHPLLHAVGFRLVPVEDPQHLYDGVRGVRWAEPDIVEAAAALRSVRDASHRSGRVARRMNHGQSPLAEQVEVQSEDGVDRSRHPAA